MQLRPRSGEYTAALAFYREASLSACLGELHGLSGDKVALLRARTLIRASKPAEALDELDRISSRDHVVSAEREVLRITALTRTGAHEELAETLGTARAYCIGLPGTAIHAELAYYVGLAAFDADDVETFRSSNNEILELQDVGDDAYVVPLAHTRARAYEALAIAEAIDGRQSGQYTRASLEELDRSSIKDAWIASMATHNLAGYVRDFDWQESSRELTDRYNEIRWTEDLADRRYYVALALGWSAALRGEEVGAFRWFREAGSAASTPIAAMDVAVDRARLACELRADAISVEEVEHASKVARMIDWSNAVERKEALVNLALAAAACATADARWALETYRKGGVRLWYLGARDARIHAALALADGRVALAEGRDAAAIHHLTLSFETARDIGFRWRAHQAAIELAELNAGEAFATFARTESAKRPQSWLARRSAQL